jgi:cytoskeletal protein RodZ
MPLENSSTRRSTPKTTPPQTPMQIRTQVQVQVRVQVQIQSPTRRKTKRRHVLLLPAPLLAIFLVWLGLILLAHSQFQLQHINSIHLFNIDMSSGQFVHNPNHNSTHRFHRLRQPRQVLVLSNKTTASSDSVSEDSVHDDKSSYEIVHIIQTR